MDLSQAHRLAEMAVDMTDQPDLQHTVERMLSLARESVNCDAVGVLLVQDHCLVTAATTDDRVIRADELQVVCDEGPCRVPKEGRHGPELADVVLIEDTEQDERWPLWCRQVAGLGWRSVLSLRLYSPTRTLGALNLYTCSPGGLTAAVDLARVFGRHASVALMRAQYGDSLRAAVTSRHVIGQAQGILMERYRMDADRAFTVLRRYSQNRNIKLRTIAEQVIATHRLPE